MVMLHPPPASFLSTSIYRSPSRSPVSSMSRVAATTSLRRSSSPFPTPSSSRPSPSHSPQRRPTASPRRKIPHHHEASEDVPVPAAGVPAAAAAPVSVRRLRVVRCMAKERWVRMVAKQIQRELADMLTRDPIMQRVVLPEAALGADRYLSSPTTIADVELSNDLQVCKVYVSVFRDERGKKVAMAGLKDKTKYVRSQIGKRMKLRLTPQIRFIEDESLQRGSRILTILDKLKEEREQREGCSHAAHWCPRRCRAPSPLRRPSPCGGCRGRRRGRRRRCAWCGAWPRSGRCGWWRSRSSGSWRTF